MHRFHAGVAAPDLSQFTALRRLDLQDCRSVTGLPGLAALAHLTAIDLKGESRDKQISSFTMPFGERSLCDLQDLSRCQRLAHLGMRKTWTGSFLLCKFASCGGLLTDDYRLQAAAP